jgi:cell division protein FtsB
MRNFQEKNKFKRFMRSKPVLVLLTVILIAFAWNLVILTGKLQETYKNKKIEQEKISDLENRKSKRISDIEKLNTDKGKEEVIREKFGVVKDGEQVIVIVDDKSQTATPSQVGSNGFFSFIKNIFKFK